MCKAMRARFEMVYSSSELCSRAAGLSWHVAPQGVITPSRRASNESLPRLNAITRRDV